jgi:hypothetical protein
MKQQLKTLEDLHNFIDKNNIDKNLKLIYKKELLNYN